MTRRRAPAAFVPLVSDFAEHYRGRVADWLLAELERLHTEASDRLQALDTERERRLAEPLDAALTPEQSAEAYAVSPEHAKLVAEAVRVARSTSQFELASPGSINPALLRGMLRADDWPDSALYAVLALTATLVAADAEELSRTYLGAAREALALADLADAADALEAPAQAKRDARRARLVEFAEIYREIRAGCRSEKEALLAIGERMSAGLSTVETYKRDAKAAGLL